MLDVADLREILTYHDTEVIGHVRAMTPDEVTSMMLAMARDN